MDEKLGGALEQAATLQEAVKALEKACAANFNYKAISGQQKKSKKDAKGRAEEPEEMPKFESFPALLKYMLARPLERIEQE